MTERTAEERFFTRLVEDGDCWLWPTANARTGYGHFFETRRTATLAHRWSYQFFRGPIPEGLILDHLCRNRRCVNPDHLDPVTQRVNLVDRSSLTLAGTNARKEMCDHGHEFDSANTYITPDGRRQCRACQRRHAKTWRDRNRNRPSLARR